MNKIVKTFKGEKEIVWDNEKAYYKGTLIMVAGKVISLLLSIKNIQMKGEDENEL